MCPTAGTYVGVWKRHNPHHSVQFFLAAVFYCFCFLFRIRRNINLFVCPYSCIGFLLKPIHIFYRKFSVKVNGYGIFSHVKSHIIISEFVMYQTTDNVFTGVILHQIKSSLPINTASYLTPFFKRLSTKMKNFPIFFVGICDFYFLTLSLQISDITWLSSAFRVKCCLIQDNLIPFFSFPAFCYRSLKSLLISILIK